MSGSYAYGGNPPDIESAYHYGGGGLGVLGADIPSTGDDGTPYMYESVIQRPGYATKEYIGYVNPATVPSGLTLDIGEASDFTASGPDGSYPVPWLFREMGLQIGANPFVVNIGVISTVSGVTVSPAAPSVAGGATQQFSATVQGTNNPSQAVSWSASAGSINSSGLFTAPAATGSAQTITITATSTANNAKSGTATVTIPAIGTPVPTVSGVTLTPATANVSGGSTQQFAATVQGSNSPSQAITWSASIGSISANGLYTAPAATSAQQTAVITATSAADPTRSDTSAVIIPAAVTGGGGGGNVEFVTIKVLVLEEGRLRMKTVKVLA